MQEVNRGRELINYIRDSVKVTPVKVYINGRVDKIDFKGCKVFGGTDSKVVFGDWNVIQNILEENKKEIDDYVVENDRRNSAIPMLDMKRINARIEPGSIIRDTAVIGNNAVIMMGAVINLGAIVGDNTMIDMNVVLGGRATVGKDCHVGAGAVLAGVIEPPSATPVIIEDNVLIGANAVVLEGVRVGKGSVVAAGAVVIEDVEAGVVVAGSPARVIKKVDSKTEEKTQLVEDLRK